MRKITFETFEEGELAALHSGHWENELYSLGTLVLEDTPASLVMPYSTAFRTYEEHVRNCDDCGDTPVWDVGCETGTRLAHLSADAMAAQDDLAVQN